MTTRKKPVPKKPINPDCEVATRRYVKKIARGLYCHEHKVNSRTPILTYMAVLFGWLFTAALITTSKSIDSTPYVLIVGLFSVAMTVNAIDHGGDPSTYTIKKWDVPNKLDDYKEPKEDPCTRIEKYGE
jgi:hypothetical protein